MPSRHDQAWLSSAGWHAALAGAAPDLALAGAAPAHAPALEQWRKHDWPLVVTRRTPDAAPGALCLGLALPPDRGRKVRISVQVHEHMVARVEPPLSLQAAAAAAPAPWTTALTALLADVGGISLRTYGSLALQAITGLQYLSDASDIDLLFTPASVQELEAGMRLLQSHQQYLPLDGEVVFPDGAAVAWKEWRDATASGARVLVKDAAGVRLTTTASLRNLLA